MCRLDSSHGDNEQKEHAEWGKWNDYRHQMVMQSLKARQNQEKKAQIEQFKEMST